jgi:hypothetical protein
MRSVVVGKLVISASVLAAVGLLAVGVAPPLPCPAATAAPPAGNAEFAAFRGVSSCTSSACHNQDAGRGADSAKGHEYAIWLGNDPHARAYQVLFDPRSVRIQAKLDGASSQRHPVGAHQNILCLRCHVAPEAEQAEDAAPVWFSDGVGCESCHGPADGWLAAHVGPAWRGMSSKEKLSHGFHDTKDLGGRAATCMACHVGCDRAEVNHDLLAAGHPPLQFEFSSFLDRYRAYQHWSEADDRKRRPDYEAEAWAVGQASSARAALQLLASRAARTAAARQAKRPETAPPWPEFAEYACSSCHHDLKGQPPDDGAGHKSGLPGWSWYTALAPLLPEPLPPAPGRALADLRNMMEAREPDPAAIAVRAREAAVAYDEWMKRHVGAPLNTDDLRERLLALTGPDAEAVARGGWEDARQASFAISACNRSLEAVGTKARDTGMDALVDRIADELRPPPGRDTPLKFRADAVVGAMRDVHARLIPR